MRRFLQIFGLVTLIFIVVAGSGLGVLIYQGRALDAESKSFVDSAVPAIAAKWSEQQLVERATPELIKNAKPAELDAFFGGLSRLGPLVEYQGATGDATMSYFTNTGSIVSASYVAKARFQNGEATFRLILLKRDGRWMIHNFHVDPEPRSLREQHA